MQSFPLTWTDQAVLDLERASDPWNIQFEIAVEGRLDADRLEQAFLTACARHPLARAKLVPGSVLASRNAWLVEDLLSFPVPVRPWNEQADLAALRTELYGRRFDLTVAPPLRALLARGPKQDLLLVIASHPAVDGIGLLRLLTSVSAAYRGAKDEPDLVPLADARVLKDHLRPADLGEVGDRALEGGRKVVAALRGPARVARDTTDQRNAPGSPTAGSTAPRQRSCPGPSPPASRSMTSCWPPPPLPSTDGTPGTASARTGCRSMSRSASVPRSGRLTW